MPFHQFKFYNTLTIPQSTKKKSFIPIKSFNNCSNIYPWKIIPKEKFLSIPKGKNFIPMKNNAYTSQQNSHTHQKMSLLNHVYTSNSHIFIPIENQKKKKKNWVKIHPSIPKATYNAKLHKSSTLSKLDNIKQLNNSKISQKSTWPHNDFHPNHTISKNSHKSKQQQNDNAPP